MTTKEIYSKFALMCSRKEYSAFDVRKKMQNWKLSENNQDKIISDLIKENFINETRFAQAFTKDKFRFNKWGKQKIRYQLKQKQISNHDIEDALCQISNEDYIDMIKNLIESKNRNIKAKSDYERKSKLMRFMAQKGFEIDEVNKIIEELN
jgi:regulatory protein